MKKGKVNLKQTFENSVFNKGEFYVKLSFTILFLTIFIISFFSFEGYKYFYATVYSDGLKGFNFQIHTIDVEQGDCFLIKLPSEQCMLIDTGEGEYSTSVCEYIEQFLYEENLNRIDYLVLTHPDSDHIGGAKTIMNNFKVGKLLRPPIYSYSESQLPQSTHGYSVDDSLTYDETILFAYENGVEIEFFYQGLELNFQGCKAEFLSPKLQNYSDSNDYSAVIMFTEQTKKFLFMGDAEEDIENGLIKEYGDYLKADVLKVGHHGSITSTSQDFLDKVNPSYAIISSGGNSRYFPNSQVVNRLENVGATILSTAEMENFVVGVKNDEVLYAVAERLPNFLALIFSVILVVIFVIWQRPIKGCNDIYFTKKPLK